MNMSPASTTPSTEDILVRKDIFVRASQQRCFDTFTKEMKAWWPLASHHVGKADAKAVIVEPFVGGRVYELGVDESECTWGHVLTWEPHGLFAFRWELSAEFQVDPSIDTQVEVTFTPMNGGTQVDLVHRGLRAYGAKTEEMRTAFDSKGGWSSLLAAFAGHASIPEAS